MADNELLQSTAVDANNDYNASEIQVLEGLEAVRKRPGMYIGSTSTSGLHHLVYEIVDNSIDEALAGYCTDITVQINPDNTITVVDNGRGIPVDIQAQTGRPALEVVFTVLHAGGKFGGGGYKVSGGLHGVGASVVNALSEWLTVQVHKDGKIHEMKFSRGHITQEMTIVGTTDHTGTRHLQARPRNVRGYGLLLRYPPHPYARGGVFERGPAHPHHRPARGAGAERRDVLRGRHPRVRHLPQ